MGGMFTLKKGNKAPQDDDEEVEEEPVTKKNAKANGKAVNGKTAQKPTTGKKAQLLDEDDDEEDAEQDLGMDAFDDDDDDDDDMLDDEFNDDEINEDDEQMNDDDDDELHEDDEQDSELPIERKARLAEAREKKVAEEEAAEMQTNIASGEQFQLPDESTLEDEKQKPIDNTVLFARMKDIIFVLSDFKNKKEADRSRSEYLTQLRDDFATYFNYLPELIDRFMTMFPPAECVTSYFHLLNTNFRLHYYDALCLISWCIICNLLFVFFFSF